MSALVIDTNVYSGFLRADARAVQALRTVPEIHLPLIVLAELLAGFAAGTRVPKNRAELARFMASPRVHLLKPDAKTAEHYADTFAACADKALRSRATICGSQRWRSSTECRYSVSISTSPRCRG